MSDKVFIYWDNSNIYISSSDRILLPANTVHSSIADESGCLYVISMGFVESRRAG